MRAVKSVSLYLLHLLFRTDSVYSELGAGFVLMLWGVWWIEFEWAPTIVIMREVISPRTVGWIMLLAGFLQASAMLTRIDLLRRLSALITLWVWGFVSMLFAEHQPDSVACPTAVMFTLASVLSVFRRGPVGSYENVS